ncbi:MAG TPA: DMT family transporter [Chloroflexia bacterium]|nr:DMT family transporter [Chloroflexia bacterium]
MSETVIIEAGERPALKARMQNLTLRVYLALALGIVCIGFSAIFTKWAEVPGSVSAFYRVVIATAALSVPYALHSARARKSPERVRMTPRLMWGVGFAGIFFALDLALWNTSLAFTSAANATLLGNTSTVWVSLGAMLLFHESLKRRFWLGMFMAFAGAVIIVGRDVFEHHDLGWGDLLAVSSSLFYAAYLLGTQRVRQHVGTLPFMWLSSVVATAFMLAYVLLAGNTLTGFPLNTWLALLALGLISHALGWMAINYSLGHLPAPIASVSLLSQPVLTAILAVPLLGEALSVYQIVGGLLVLLGIYIVNRR